MAEIKEYTPFPASAHIDIELNGRIIFRSDNLEDERKLIQLDGGFSPPAKIALVSNIEKKQYWLEVLSVKAGTSKYESNVGYPNLMRVIYVVREFEIRDINGVPLRNDNL